MRAHQSEAPTINVAKLPSLNRSKTLDPGDELDFEELILRLRAAHVQMRARIVALEREVKQERGEDANRDNIRDNMRHIQRRSREESPRTPKGNSTPKGNKNLRTVTMNDPERLGLPRKQSAHSACSTEVVDIRSENAKLTKSSTDKSGRFRVSSSSDFVNRQYHGESIRSSANTMLISQQKHILGYIQAIVRHQIFEYLCSFMILLNAVFIGFETDVMATDPGKFKTLNSNVHICFNIFFTVELALRMIADGRRFFKGDQWRWNMLDFMLVFTALIELLVELCFNTSSMGLNGLRLIRLVRIIRTVRLIRTMKSIIAFQKMVFAILSSARTLFCSVFLLSFVIFFFAVIFTQTAAEELQRGEANEEEILEIRKYFGSLRLSFYSLFLAVTNGISWHYICWALFSIHWTNAGLFVAYISFVLFGVMNVVTSVFVESAIMSAQHYKDLIIQEKQRKREIAMVHMIQVFNQIDKDRSGEVSMDEMDHFLHEPSLRKYFEALDISAEDTQMLFRLLDRDNSGQIDINEFCEGCLRLRGEAKSFDIHAMIYQVQRFLSKWSDFTVYVEQKFDNADKSKWRTSEVTGTDRGTEATGTDRGSEAAVQVPGAVMAFPSTPPARGGARGGGISDGPTVGCSVSWAGRDATPPMTNMNRSMAQQPSLTAYSDAAAWTRADLDPYFLPGVTELV